MINQDLHVELGDLEAFQVYSDQTEDEEDKIDEEEVMHQTQDEHEKEHELEQNNCPQQLPVIHLPNRLEDHTHIKFIQLSSFAQGLGQKMVTQRPKLPSSEITIRFVCPDASCLKTFDKRWSLKRHLKTHSDLRPYECNLCGRSYKNQQDRRIHLEKIHDVGRDKTKRKGFERKKRQESSFTTYSWTDEDGNYYEKRVENTELIQTIPNPNRYWQEDNEERLSHGQQVLSHRHDRLFDEIEKGELPSSDDNASNLRLTVSGSKTLEEKSNDTINIPIKIPMLVLVKKDDGKYEDEEVMVEIIVEDNMSQHQSDNHFYINHQIEDEEVIQSDQDLNQNQVKEEPGETTAQKLNGENFENVKGSQPIKLSNLVNYQLLNNSANSSDNLKEMINKWSQFDALLEKNGQKWRSHSNLRTYSSMSQKKSIDPIIESFDEVR